MLQASSCHYENQYMVYGEIDDGEDFISLSDIDLILVYLGKNVFRGTKPKPVLFHHTPQPELDSPLRKDEDYPQQGV